MQMLNKQKLSDQIYFIIRERIINNEILAGSKLNIEELQDDYQISKTPLKEALSRLEYEGLVTVKPRSGTYVSVPSKEEIVQILDLREAIEGKAIALALPHIPEKEIAELKQRVVLAEEQILKGNFNPFFETDVELHKMFCDYSNNRYIQKVKEMIDSHVHWYRILGATEQQRPYKSSVRHRELLDAMLEKDFQLSCELLRIHLEEVKTAIVEDLAPE